jgi:hypothetical protein
MPEFFSEETTKAADKPQKAPLEAVLDKLNNSASYLQETTDQYGIKTGFLRNIEQVGHVPTTDVSEPRKQSSELVSLLEDINNNIVRSILTLEQQMRELEI